ncbi:MAG: hypothetical protein IKT53_01940 [Bacteroidaceae bacterium]|nr:hypothetical protein [Bacteroidaceae bacterium]
MECKDKFEFRYDGKNLVKFYYCNESEKMSTALLGSDIVIYGDELAVYQLENSFNQGKRIDENRRLKKGEKLQARPAFYISNEYNVSFSSVYTGEIMLSNLGIVINCAAGKGSAKAVLCKDGLYRMPVITISDVKYKVSDPELLLKRLACTVDLGNDFIVRENRALSISVPAIENVVRGRLNDDFLQTISNSDNKTMTLDINDSFKEYGIEIKSVSIFATLHESNLSEEQKKHNDEVKNKERQRKEIDEKTHIRNASMIESMTERDRKMITFVPFIELINTIVNSRELIEKALDPSLGSLSIGADAAGNGLLQLFEAMKNAMPEMLEVKDMLTRYEANGYVEVSDSMPDDITRRSV